MHRSRSRFALVSLVALAAFAAELTAPAVASGMQSRVAVSPASDLRSVQRGATITSSKSEVEEGGQFTLTVSIKSPAAATKVTLQRYQPSRYGWDAPEWKHVKTVSPRGKRELRFVAVATEKNAERFRVVVMYKKAKPATSNPVSVKVWRWIPLSEYDPYYLSEPAGMIRSSVALNGRSYSGWGAAYYSHTGSWEARFTPGRHCKAFRGVLGVADMSHDGSSGTIAVTADDIVVYESPVLTPGMDISVTVPLALPYRLGLRLLDTTPGGTPSRDAVESWPVVGDPGLLCSGV